MFLSLSKALIKNRLYLLSYSSDKKIFSSSELSLVRFKLQK